MNKKAIKEQLRALLAESNNYTYKALPKGGYDFPISKPPELTAWIRRVKNAISSTFKSDSAVYLMMDKGELASYKIIHNGPDKFNDAKVNLVKSIQEALKVLDNDIYGEVKVEEHPRTKLFHSRKVFVVHGHDDAAKLAVVNFIGKLELNPVILHDKPNEGRTIIEKFENHADVGFAVVLMTPDDVGALAAEKNKLKPRARQNVILELGFFLGSLGRKRVCALYKENVEIPSDYKGVLFIPMDTNDGWQLSLAKEIKAAGIEIDLNKAM